MPEVIRKTDGATFKVSFTKKYKRGYMQQLTASIAYPAIGEDMNEAIARYVMQFPEAALKHNRVPIPAYSTDYYAVGAVLEILREHLGFNHYLRARLEQQCPQWVNQPAWAYSMLPYEICIAAMQAVNPLNDLGETV